MVGHQVSEALWVTRDVIYRDFETFDIFSFPVVAPELVFAQLATTLDLADLVALGDAVIGGATPLGRTDDLLAMAGMWSPRPGAAKLRAAVKAIRPGSLSRPESLCRLQAVSAGIPEPQLNVQVADTSGRDIAMADLSWPEFRVLVEYEGDLHRKSRSKFRSDITRGELYVDGDWRGLRVTADDVFSDPNPFLARLARALEARGWRQPQLGLRHVAGARR